MNRNTNNNNSKPFHRKTDDIGNEKQKKRFEKYQGDDMHFFVGKVKKLVEPKGDIEEKGWDVNERLMKIKDAIKIIEGYKPFPFELKEYYELKLKILNGLNQ